jgi:hypothetical protein
VHRLALRFLLLYILGSSSSSSDPTNPTSHGRRSHRSQRFACGLWGVKKAGMGNRRGGGAERRGGRESANVATPYVKERREKIHKCPPCTSLVYWCTIGRFPSFVFRLQDAWLHKMSLACAHAFLPQTSISTHARTRTRTHRWVRFFGFGCVLLIPDLPGIDKAVCGGEPHPVPERVVSVGVWMRVLNQQRGRSLNMRAVKRGGGGYPGWL